MYSTDFNALAARMAAGLQDVRVCLLLSSDGLTLGAFPESSEERGRDVWDAVQTVGDPHRGFLDLGEEIWVMARRGAYAAIIVTAPTVRPGLLLDKLDFMLRQAEEARLRVEVETGMPAQKPELPRRPRSPLHRGEPPKPEPRKAPAGARPELETHALEVEGPKYTPPEELTGAAQRVIDVTKPDPDATMQASGTEAPVLDPPTVRPIQPEQPPVVPETPPVAPEAPSHAPAPPPPPAFEPPPPEPPAAPQPEPEPEPQPHPEPEPEPELEPQPEPEPEPEAEPAAEASVAFPETEEAPLEEAPVEEATPEVQDEPETETADPVAELAALAQAAAAEQVAMEDPAATQEPAPEAAPEAIVAPTLEPPTVEPARPESPIAPEQDEPEEAERPEDAADERPDPQELKAPPADDEEEERGVDEVDRVALSREFGKLFSDGGS